MGKWIIILLVTAFLIQVIRNQVKNARYSKKQKQKDAEMGIGPMRKKARGVKNIAYANKCYKKGDTKKYIEALESIASQEGWLKDSEDAKERLSAAKKLLELAVLGHDAFDHSVPEYKCRENAERAVGWLLEETKRDILLRARQYGNKPENYGNRTYFLWALVCPDGEERLERMKKAAVFYSNEALVAYKKCPA